MKKSKAQRFPAKKVANVQDLNDFLELDESNMTENVEIQQFNQTENVEIQQFNQADNFAIQQFNQQNIDVLSEVNSVTSLPGNDDLSYFSEDEDENENENYYEAPAKIKSSKNIASRKLILDERPQKSVAFRKPLLDRSMKGQPVKIRNLTTNSGDLVTEAFDFKVKTTNQSEKPKITSQMLMSGKKLLKRGGNYDATTTVKIDQKEVFDKHGIYGHFPLVLTLEYLNQRPRNYDVIYSLDLSGIQQLTDMFFYMYRYKNIDLLQLQTINLTGCNNITDKGMFWCSKSMPDLKTVIVNGCKNITQRTLSYFLDREKHMEKIEMIATSVMALPEMENTMAVSVFGCPLVSPPTAYYLENFKNAVPTDKLVQLKHTKIVILRDSSDNVSVGSVLTGKSKTNTAAQVWTSWTPNSQSKYMYNMYEIAKGHGIENMVLNNGGIVVLPCRPENTDEQVTTLAQHILSVMSMCTETAFILAILSPDGSTTEESSNTIRNSVLEKLSELATRLVKEPLNTKLDKDWVLTDYEFAEQTTFANGSSLAEKLNILISNASNEGSLLQTMILPMKGKLTDSQMALLTTAVDNLQKAYPWHGIKYFKDTVSILSSLQKDKNLRPLNTVLESLDKAVVNSLNQQSAFREMGSIMNLSHQKGMGLYFPNVDGKPCWTNPEAWQELMTKLVQPAPQKAGYIQGLGENIPCWKKTDFGKLLGTDKNVDLLVKILEDRGMIIRLPCDLKDSSVVYVMIKDLPGSSDVPIDRLWAPNASENEWMVDKFYRIPTYTDHILFGVVRKLSSLSRISLLWRCGLVIQQGPVTVLVENIEEDNGCQTLYVAVRMDKLVSGRTPAEVAEKLDKEVLFCCYRSITNTVESILQERQCFYSRIFPCQTCDPSRNRYLAAKPKNPRTKFDEILMKADHALGRKCQIEGSGKNVERQDYLGPNDLGPLSHLPNHVEHKVTYSSCTRCYMCNNCCVNGMECPQNLKYGVVHRGNCKCSPSQQVCKHCGMCNGCIQQLTQSYCRIRPSFAFGKEPTEGVNQYGSFIKGFTQNTGQLTIKEKMCPEYFSHLEISLTLGSGLTLSISSSEKLLELNSQTGVITKGTDEVTIPNLKTQRGDSLEILVSRCKDNSSDESIQIVLRKNTEPLYTVALPSSTVSVTIKPESVLCLVLTSNHLLSINSPKTESRGADDKTVQCCGKLPSVIEMELTEVVLPHVESTVENPMTGRLKDSQKSCIAIVLPEMIDRKEIIYPSFQSLRGSQLCHELCYFQALTEMPDTCEGWTKDELFHLVNAVGFVLPKQFQDPKSQESSTLYHLVLQWLTLMVHYPAIELPTFDKLFPHLANEQIGKIQLEQSLNQLMWMQAVRMYMVSGAAHSGMKLGYPDKSYRKVLQDAIGANAPYSELHEAVKHEEWMTDDPTRICSGHKASLSMNMQLQTVDITTLTDYASFITQLVLSMNSLTELPPLLFSNLPHLINIELSNNFLEEIPKSIGTCKKLYSIGLKFNNLTSLPDELVECQQLARIDIGNNMMDTIPLVLTKVPSLKRLYAVNMMITTLPEEIGNITELEKLYLNGNCLISLPKGIAKLKNLEDFSISGVVWSKGSAQRSLMSRKHFEEFLYEQGILRWLDAHDKDRDELFKAFDEDANGTLDAKELGNLDALLFNIFPRFGYKGTEAPEDDTPSGFPEEIFELTNLRYLNLNYQGLVHVPAGIKKLQKLEVLSLTYNPNLLSITAEVGDLPALKRLIMDECPLLKTPPKEIREKGFNTVYAYLKRLLTGSVECKRTKLMLVGLGGAGKTSLCRALINDSLQQSLTGSEAITDGIDIANWTVKYDGEQIMYSVWDFAGQTVYYNTHQFFLSNRSVYLLLWNVRLGYEHSGLNFWLSSITVHAPLAPIFVVGSHIDQVSKVELPMEELQEAYPQIQDFLFISSYSGQGIDDLKKKLYKATLQEEYMGELIPQAWLSFENNIVKTRTTRKIDILDYTVIEKKANEAGIVDKTEVAQAVSFLHDLGSLQHFNNQFLKSKVVINPQWIVDVMACVVSVKQNVIEEGRLKHENIKHVWSNYSSAMHNWLLRLTEEFDLTFPLTDQKINLVPCLMPEKRPQFDWPEPKKEEGVLENKIIYKFDYLPAGLFNRGQVRLHQFSDSSIIWKRGSFLRKNEHIALVQQTKDQEMIVKVQGPRPENALFLIHEVFEGLVFESFHGLRFDYQLPCPECLKQTIKDPHMFSASTVRRAIELKAPFLQCLKYFHTILVTDMQAAMPPDTNNDFDVHLAKTVSGLREMKMNMAIDIFMSFCEKDAPKDRSKVIHPADVHNDLKKAGYTCWFPEGSNKSSTDLLAQALINSSVFVVFMSSNYANDSQCCDIFQYAKLTLGKPIIVIAVGENFEWRKSRMGIFLQDVVFVNMTVSKKPVYDEKLKELLNQLDLISDTTMIGRDTPECFISYCWSNSMQACKKGTRMTEGAIGSVDPREIKEFLEKEGKIKCWIDIERIGMTGLFEEIVKGLVNARIVIACVSDEYANSAACSKEFIYAAQALQLPIVCAEVGTGNKWMYTSVGMLAFHSPKVNLKTKNDDSLIELLKLVKENIGPEKVNLERDKPKDSKISKQNELSFQELYELAQRKFLRQIAAYANAQDIAVYPRLFVVDIIKREIQSVNEEKTEVDVDGKEKILEIQDSGFKHRQFSVHMLCEYEYGWHKEGEAIMLPDNFGSEVLDGYAPYLARVTAITRHSKELIMNCFSDTDGQKYVKWLQETSLSVTDDLQDVYQQFRQEVFNLDQEKNMGGLTRCRLPSGKIIWLCDKHCKQMKVTVLSDEVIVKESKQQGLVDHMIESLRKVDKNTVHIKFDSSRKAKKTIEGEQKFRENGEKERMQERRNRRKITREPSVDIIRIRSPSIDRIRDRRRERSLSIASMVSSPSIDSTGDRGRERFPSIASMVSSPSIDSTGDRGRERSVSRDHIPDSRRESSPSKDSIQDRRNISTVSSISNKEANHQNDESSVGKEAKTARSSSKISIMAATSKKGDNLTNKRRSSNVSQITPKEEKKKSKACSVM